MATDAKRRGNAQAMSFMNVVAGIWLVVAPWILGYSDLSAALWNDVVVGVAIIVLAGIRAASPARFIPVSWANVLLGLWLILAPFVLQYGELTAAAVVGSVALWNDIIVGLVVITLAVFSATSSERSV
jgi:hypothetical protein